MKKLLILLCFLPLIASAQNTNLWYTAFNQLKPVVNSWGLNVRGTSTLATTTMADATSTGYVDARQFKLHNPVGDYTALDLSVFNAGGQYYPFIQVSSPAAYFGERTVFLEDSLLAVGIDRNPSLGFLDEDGEGALISFATSTNYLSFVGANRFNFGADIFGSNLSLTGRATSSTATTTGAQYVGSLTIGTLDGLLAGANGVVYASSSPYMENFTFGNATGTNLNLTGLASTTGLYIGDGTDYLNIQRETVGVFGNAYFIDSSNVGGAFRGLGIKDSVYIFDRDATTPSVTFVKSDLSKSDVLQADFDNDNLTITFGSTTVNDLHASNIYASNMEFDYFSVDTNMEINANFNAFGVTGLGGYADEDYRLTIYPQNATGSLRIASSSAEILHIPVSGIFDWNPNNLAHLDFNLESDSDSSVFYMDASRDTVGVGSSTPWAKLSVTNNTSGDPSFIVEDTSSPDSSPFMIDSGGLVGIGTSTPLTDLHVENQSATTSITISTGASAKGGRIILEDIDGAGCSEVTSLNGTLSAKIIDCPTGI